MQPLLKLKCGQTFDNLVVYRGKRYGHGKGGKDDEMQEKVKEIHAEQWKRGI